LPNNIIIKGNNYNKRCPCTPSDFIGFWVNSQVVVNGDQQRRSGFIGLMNSEV
jgi:hypothetical protein